VDKRIQTRERRPTGVKAGGIHGTQRFYQFATGFWWLIFPIGWGVAGMLRAWMKHKQAQQALDILASYAGQNKEPPPEVLALLAPRERKQYDFSVQPLHYLIGGFFFAATAVAFAVLYLCKPAGGAPDDMAGLLFVIVLMAGFAVGLFLTAWISSRTKNQIPPT
jgi:hypothetical protein